jgi:hypothetical protein
MSDELEIPVDPNTERGWWRPWWGAMTLVALYAALLLSISWLADLYYQKWEDAIGEQFRTSTKSPNRDWYSALSGYAARVSDTLANAQVIMFALWAALAPHRLAVRLGVSVAGIAFFAWLADSAGMWYGPFPVIELVAWFLIIFGVWTFLRSRFGYRLLDKNLTPTDVSGIQIHFSTRVLLTLVTLAAVSLGLWQLAEYQGELGLIVQTYVTAIPIILIQSLSAVIVLGRRFRPLIFLILIPAALIGSSLWWASVAKYLWGWGVSHAPFWSIFWESFPNLAGSTVAIVLSAWVLRLSGYRVARVV